MTVNDLISILNMVPDSDLDTAVVETFQPIAGASINVSKDDNGQKRIVVRLN